MQVSNLSKETEQMTSNIIAINADDIKEMGETEIFNLPPKFVLKFQDGEMMTTREETVYSWYLWVLHRRFPLTPLLKAHHVGGSTITPTTHMKLLSKIRYSTVTAYGDEYGVLEEVNTAVYDAMNDLYNGMTVKLEAYITSISILDFMDIHFHPEVFSINRSMKDNENLTDIEIDDNHNKILKIMETDPALRNNAVARAAKFKLVKPAQILQCISARGYVTDVDNARFRFPIRTGYVEGMRSIVDYATESRTAATAEFMTQTPMQQSEYLNRLLQISSSVVKRIHPGDCGSRKFIPYLISDNKKLVDMEGIHYFDENGVEKVITADDKHMVGKLMHIRSIFTCIHPDRYGVCAHCYGDLSYNAIPTDNLGHNAAVTLQSGQSQLLLSHKHFTSSAHAKNLILSSEANRYMEKHIGFNNNAFIKQQAKDVNVSVVLFLEEGRNLDDLMYLDTLDKVTPERITSVTALGFILKQGEFSEKEVVNVTYDGRTASLTEEALRYVFDHGFTVNEKGAYIINLKDWDRSLPFLAVPEEQFSAVEYSDMIRTFVKGSSGKSSKRTAAEALKTIIDFTDPAKALSAFHDLVSERLKVNLSHLQVILFATMSADLDASDYNLPYPDDRTKGHFTKHDQKMKNGNISAAMAYQTQVATIYNPKTYLHQARPTHEFDFILLGDMNNGTST